VLLTGMSGTGKSTVLDELARRGHRVIDTDDPGWIIEAKTADGSEPLWDLGRVRALLDEHGSGWLFVAGCVANQRALYNRFDKVVLLSAPVDVLLARVAQVARRDNSFGSTTEDRTKIASDLAAFEPVVRTGADHEVVTTAPIPVVVSEVEKLAAAVR
jgi:shikimate kinase